MNTHSFTFDASLKTRGGKCEGLCVCVFVCELTVDSASENHSPSSGSPKFVSVNCSPSCNWSVSRRDKRLFDDVNEEEEGVGEVHEGQGAVGKWRRGKREREIERERESEKFY